MEPIKNICLQYLLSGKPHCVQLDCLFSQCHFKRMQLRYLKCMFDALLSDSSLPHAFKDIRLEPNLAV